MDKWRNSLKSFFKRQFHTVRDHQFYDEERSFLKEWLYFAIMSFRLITCSFQKKHFTVKKSEKTQIRSDSGYHSFSHSKKSVCNAP